eukprot:6488088-Amphidinium_carterae.2
MVILDEAAQRRFPRLVTLVQLGAVDAKLDTPSEDAQPPSAAAPVELLLEIDDRAANDGDRRTLAKQFLDEVLMSSGAHNKMYSIRMQHNDPYVAFSAKFRLTVDQANKVITASGRNGVFTKTTKQSAGLTTKYALIWLTEDAMHERPLLVLQNAQTQLNTTGGLCRSQRVFGMRAEPRLAGSARATLGVQPAHTFNWNESLVPTEFYLLRGIPVAMSDQEVAKLVYEAFQWQNVPVRRLKSAANGLTSWLIGAEKAPSATHARVGKSLITVENYDAAAVRAQKPKKRAGRQADKENSRPQNAPWQDMQDSSASWDPWAAAWSEDTADSTWWRSKPRQAQQTPKQDAWANYTATPAAILATPRTDHALAERVANIEQAVSRRAEQLDKVEGRVQSVETSITAISTQMQSNFDKLFVAFENRNADAPRKAPT